METWHEKYLHKGKIVKTIAKFQYCEKCGLKVVGKANDTFPLCILCYYKKLKWYKRAVELLKHGFTGEGHYGKCDIKEDGYFLKERMLLTALMSGVLNCGSLNRTPKVPDFKLTDYYPEYWVNKFFPQGK